MQIETLDVTFYWFCIAEKRMGFIIKKKVIYFIKQKIKEKMLFFLYFFLMPRSYFNRYIEVWVRVRLSTIKCKNVKNKGSSGSSDDCFNDCCTWNQIDLNKTEPHERNGFSRGFCLCPHVNFLGNPFNVLSLMSHEPISSQISCL